MNDPNSHMNFSAADIERYHKGQLSPKERHALEKAALDDPFLADALEGYQFTETPAADLAFLREQLEAKTNGAKVIPLQGGSRPGRSFSWWKAAAVVLLLGGTGWLTYRFAFSHKDNQLAVQTEDQKTKAPENNPARPETKNSDEVTADSGTTVLTPSVNSGKEDIKGSIAEPRVQDNPKAVTTNATGGSAAEAIPGTDNRELKTEDFAAVKPDAEKRVLDVKKDAAEDKYYRSETVTVKPAPVTSNAAGLPAAPAPGNQGVVFNDLIKTERAREEENKQLSRKSVANNNVVAAQRNNNNVALNNNRAYNFNGRVVDANNNALPFANVTNLNDNVGTYADARGNFTLISTDSVLNVQARSLGFETRNYTLQQNNFRQNQIILQDDRSQKDEYVSNTKNVKVNAEKLKERGSMKDETPEPADGWGNYNTYVANNIELPENVLTRQSGEVEVSFDVDKNGNPVNIQITKSLCKECDAEVIRLVKQGPKWKRSSKKTNKAKVTVSF